MVGVALVVMASAAVAGDCSCTADKAANGWCGECKVGHVSGVKLTSEKLYAALQGEKVDAESIKCPGCKSAFAKHEVCEGCKVHFAGDQGYKSPVAYHLARGKVIDKAAADMKCEGCKKAAEAGHGWCEDCKAGMVANRAYKNKKNYEQAVEAQTILAKANEAAGRCDTCAVAMVTDGKCEACSVNFKGGKKSDG
jgi:hypothetical protein